MSRGKVAPIGNVVTLSAPIICRLWKCVHFFKIFGALPWESVMVDLSELSTKISFFEIGQRSPLPLGDLRKIYFTCYWHTSSLKHVIVTKTIYFIYNCNKRKSPRGKGQRCQIYKNWHPPAQLTKIYQNKVVSRNFWKMQSLNRFDHHFC